MSKIILESFSLLRMPCRTFDPFLFCVHHDDMYPPGDAELGVPQSLLHGRDLGSDFSRIDGWSMYHGHHVPGFPSHPHRGFETITITTRGMVDHSDSLHCTARYGDGDTQWMTAGRGIQHSEMFPLLRGDGGNPLNLVQLWLNLPRAKKRCAPCFSMFWREETPVARAGAGGAAWGRGAEVRIVAGELFGQKPLPPPPDSWAADPRADVAVWLAEISAGGSVELPPAATPDVNRAIYPLRGERLQLGGDGAEVLERGTGAKVQPDVPLNLTAVGEDARVLLLQGRPIGEPVAQHGPFVMNTEEEITQTIREYGKTEFGGWPWPSSDYHHPRDTQRHALHPSGKKEFPPQGKQE